MSVYVHVCSTGISCCMWAFGKIDLVSVIASNNEEKTFNQLMSLCGLNCVSNHKELSYNLENICTSCVLVLVGK